MDEVTGGEQAATEESAIVAEEAAQVEETQSEATTDDHGDEEAAQPDEQRKPPKGVQKRLDELTRQRHDAARERDYWRDMAMRLTPQEQQSEPAPQGPPTLEQFDYDESAYQRANSDYMAKQVQETVRQTLQSERDAASQQARMNTVVQRLQDAAARNPEFNDMLDDIPQSPAVMELLATSDNATEVLFELGRDPARMTAFAALNPVMQAYELGRIADRVDARKATPNTKPTPPAPPQTIAGISAGMGKSPSEMSMAEYVQWRRGS